MKYYQDLRAYYQNSQLRSAIRDLVHFTQDIYEQASILASDTFQELQEFMVSVILLELKLISNN